MQHDPVETAELLAFAKTVDAKSVSRAAAELRVPRATVSRRLARLEERLGTRLLRRTTRSLVLTDAGDTLYRHARIVLEAVDNAEASVRRTDDAARGDLRVSLPPAPDPTLVAMLCEFGKAHPDVRLHLHFSSQLVDLQRGGYDVAVRASTEELAPGLVARTLATSPILAVASPSYLAEHGTPRTARELSDHRCLMGFARGELPQTYWPTGGKGKMHVEGAFFTNDVGLLCDAAARGLGIALLPLMIARPFLETGELVQVLAKAIHAESRVSVVFVEREFVPAHVRAFVDAVTRWGRAELSKGLPERCKEATRVRRKR